MYIKDFGIDSPCLSSPYFSLATLTIPSIHTYAAMASNNIKLYTVGTPNGRKVSVYLEELGHAYGLKYECVFYSRGFDTFHS